MQDGVVITLRIGTRGDPTIVSSGSLSSLKVVDGHYYSTVFCGALLITRRGTGGSVSPWLRPNHTSVLGVGVGLRSISGGGNP